jgi:hypothetical protein
VRPGLRRALVIVLAVGLLGASATGVVAAVGYAGAKLDGGLAPATPQGRFSRPIPTTLPTTTTTLPAEFAGLRGRPPSPVDLDPAACSPALQAGAFRPQRPHLWPADPPVPTSPITDEAARGEIGLLMRRRFRRDDPEGAVREALAIYDSPVIRAITNDAIPLRAALAELKGTIAEPALRFLFTTERDVQIGFGPLSQEGRDERLGEAWNHGNRLVITILDTYQHERPVLVTPILFHELLHQNNYEPAYFSEELINNVLDARLALEQARDLPEAYTGSTPASSFNRITGLAQLNTRVGPQLSVHRSDVADVLPDFEGSPTPSFAAVVRSMDHYRTLPESVNAGHPTLVEVLRSMSNGAEVAGDTAFSHETVAFLETHAGLGLCDQLVAARTLDTVPAGSAGDRLVKDYVARLPE